MVSTIELPFILVNSHIGFVHLGGKHCHHRGPPPTTRSSDWAPLFHLLHPPAVLPPNQPGTEATRLDTALTIASQLLRDTEWTVHSESIPGGASIRGTESTAHRCGQPCRLSAVHDTAMVGSDDGNHQCGSGIGCCTGDDCLARDDLSESGWIGAGLHLWVAEQHELVHPTEYVIPWMLHCTPVD